VKKCTQCSQVLSDETKFCFKCGGAAFEPVADAGSGTYQQPTAPQQTYQQPPVQTSYQQPPQQPYYPAQPAYQAQPAYNNTEPATIGDFLLFFLFMIIPIWNIIYFIMLLVGSPKYKRSMVNFARASLIWGAIILAIYIILIIVFGAALFSMFGNLSSYGYSF
jgi:hypothetical protein